MENKQHVPSNSNTLEFKVNMGFLSSRFAGSGSFLLALLLFFLPFISFKCGNVKIGHVTGIQAALHLQPTLNDNMFKDMLGPLKSLDRSDLTKKTSESKNDNAHFAEVVQSLGNETGASICIPIAFLLGIVGAVLLLLKKSSAAMGSLVAGWFAVGLMIFSAVMVIAKVKRGMSGMMGGMSGLAGSMGISIGPTVWYYITIVFFALAAWLSKRQYHAYKADEQRRMEEEVMAQYPIIAEPAPEQGTTDA